MVVSDRLGSWSGLTASGAAIMAPLHHHANRPATSSSMHTGRAMRTTTIRHHIHFTVTSVRVYHDHASGRGLRHHDAATGASGNTPQVVALGDTIANAIGVLSSANAAFTWSNAADVDPAISNAGRSRDAHDQYTITYAAAIRHKHPAVVNITSAPHISATRTPQLHLAALALGARVDAQPLEHRRCWRSDRYASG